MQSYMQELYAYLDIPPPVTSPRFIDKAYKSGPIKFEQALCVPGEMRRKQRVLKKFECPIPQRSVIKWKTAFFILVRNSHSFLFELLTSNETLSRME